MNGLRDYRQRHNSDDDSAIDQACALNERTERGSRNMMITCWVLLAIACLICGLFITGWRELIYGIIFAVAVSALFAWIGDRIGR